MRHSNLQRGATLIATALIAIGLGACGGGGEASSTTTPPPPLGNVGPAGGTVVSGDGNASLAVPAGAVGSTIAVTLTSATSGYLADPQIVPGTVYQIDAPDTALAQPATLSLQIPAGLASALAPQAGALSEQQHALGLLDTTNLLGCTPDVAPGSEVPPATICVYQSSDLNGCPASTPKFLGIKNLGYPVFTEFVIYCEAPPIPKPLLVGLSPDAKAAQLATSLVAGQKAQTSLNKLGRSLIGLMVDKTPPTIQVTSIVTDLGNGTGKIQLSAFATDNVGLANVTFYKTKANVNAPFVTIATFIAPPYVWNSGTLPISEIYDQNCGAVACTGTVYAAVATDTGGNITEADTGAYSGPPFVQSFTATPATVPAGGGDVVLSWGVASAGHLFIDKGVGYVTGLSSTTVHVTVPTTFTLTAINDAGNTYATVPVAVMAQAAPTIAAFTATPASLPAGGGIATLAWTTTDANNLSIDQGVGAVTGTSKSVSVAANTTFTLTASNPSGTVTRQVAVAVALNNDRFVDVAAGSDGNACSQAAPCKTIAKGLSGAPSGSTVWLVSGIYGVTTQGTLGQTVPDGVTLRAVSPGGAVVTNGPLVAAGSAVVNGIVLDLDSGGQNRGSISATSSSGTPTLLLSGVLARQTDTFVIGGNVKATMVPGALAGGLYTSGLNAAGDEMIVLSGTAELTIQGGIIDGNAKTSNFGLVTALGNSKLTLDGATIRNRPVTAIRVGDSASVALKNGALIDDVSVGIATSGANNVSLDGSQISNYTVGISIASGTSVPTVSIKNSSISHGVPPPLASYGILSDASGADAIVTLDGATLTNNYCAIRWGGMSTATTFDIKNSAITGNGGCTGIQLGGLGSLKMRTTNVSNNGGPGISIVAPTLTLDLGTQASPGGNTFTGNTGSGLFVSLVSGTITIQAVGNLWIPNQEGADDKGRYATPPTYAPLVKTGPANGQNYNIPAGVTLGL